MKKWSNLLTEITHCCWWQLHFISTQSFKLKCLLYFTVSTLHSGGKIKQNLLTNIIWRHWALLYVEPLSVLWRYLGVWQLSQFVWSIKIFILSLYSGSSTLVPGVTSDELFRAAQTSKQIWIGFTVFQKGTLPSNKFVPNQNVWVDCEMWFRFVSHRSQNNSILLSWILRTNKSKTKYVTGCQL